MLHLLTRFTTNIRCHCQDAAGPCVDPAICSLRLTMFPHPPTSRSPSSACAMFGESRILQQRVQQFHFYWQSGAAVLEILLFHNSWSPTATAQSIITIIRPPRQPVPAGAGNTTRWTLTSVWSGPSPPAAAGAPCTGAASWSGAGSGSTWCLALQSVEKEVN